MSGGVDSSVVAALLKAQGHDVIGVTLQLYDHGEAVDRRGSCCAGQDIHDARRVADRLGIPHYVLDYEQRFKATVMQSFADSYVCRRNADPVCASATSRSSSASCCATAQELGADRSPPVTTSSVRAGPAGPELYRGADADRDQSYFLFATTRAQLDFAAASRSAPIRRPSVRALRGGAGAAGRRKPDSQDICFVPQGRYTSVVERLKPGAVEAGDIVHVDGRVLGRHSGIVNFTIGQRGAWASRRRAALRRAARRAPSRWWSVRARACMRTGSR